MDRRQFLKSGAAGVLTLGHKLLGASSDPFARVKLGETGIETSRIAMGTGVKAFNRQSNLTRMDKEDALALIRQAYESGVRFFDCADTYGSHELVAEALAGKPRDSYVLSTKMWNRPGGIPEPERPDANIVVDRFRKEFKTDYIDIVQLHCMVEPNWTDLQKRQMDILDNLKAKGIIRAHGVSVHSFYAMLTCLRSPWVDVVHVRLNAYGDKMDTYDPRYVAALVQKLHTAGKGIIAMKLIGEGKYRNEPTKIEETLRFVLNLKSVDVLLVGFDQKGQVKDFTDRVRAVMKANG